MAEDMNNRLQVGLGFKIDDIGGGLTQFATNAAKISTLMNQLGVSMSKVENSSQGIGFAFNNAQKIMTQYQAGLINSRKATDELIKEQQRLNEELSKVSKGTEEYDNLALQLAEVNGQMKVLTEQRVSYEQKANKEILDANKRTVSEQKALNRQLTVDYQNSIKQRVAAHKQLEKAYKNTSMMSDRMFNSLLQVSGVNLLVSEFNKLNQEIVENEYNTINNQRLMGDFSDTLRDSLNNSAAEIAKATGIAIADAQQIQGSWIRINEEYAKSAELLGKMSDITAKFMNVSGITEAEEAVKLLNSSLLQFNLTGEDVAKNLEEIGNKFAYMADTTAMGTADEYAQGIAKMGANVKNMNGDIDDAIVLISLIGDKLAKTGEEAGNSLNTVTAYMHRAKTLKLFDNLAEELGDANLSLRDGEEGLKDYKESIETIAEAYRRLKEAGDEVGMNNIIESLGATRQRAATQAVLEAIASPDGQNIDYYETLLSQATESGNYLEDQNARLMESAKNQANALVVSLQQAGMALANSGILDGITMLMNAGEKLFNFFSKLPEPMLGAISMLLQFKVASAGIEKFSSLTGITNKLNQFTTRMQVGTQAQIQYSQALSSTASDLMVQEQLLLKQAEVYAYSTKGKVEDRNGCLEWKQALTLCNQEIAELDAQLAQGIITTEQHDQAVRQSVATYNNKVHLTQTGTNAIRQSTIAQSQNNQKIKEEVVLDNTATVSKNKLTLAQRQNEAIKKSALLTAIQTWAVKQKEIVNDKLATLAQQELTASMIAQSMAASLAKVGLEGLTWATGKLALALNLVSPILTAITLGMSVLSIFGIDLFGGSKKSAEDYTESLSDLEEALQTGRERVEELRQAQANTGNADGAIQKQIDKQNELNDSYAKSIELIKQKQFYDEYYADGDTSSKSEEIQNHINNLNEYDKELSKIETKIANVTRSRKVYEDIIASGGTLTESQRTAYNSANNSIAKFQKDMADLNREARNSAAVITQSAKDIQDAYDDGLINEDDWNNDFSKLIDDIGAVNEKVKLFLGDAKNSVDEFSESLSNSFDLSNLMNYMDSLADSTKSLVEAQNQLAQGAELSKDHLWELAMQYPELLYQANLFADGSTESVKAAIDATLDMYSQDFDNKVDLKIAELELTKEFIESILDYEQQKLDAITTGEIESANGRISIEADTARFINEYNNLIGQQHNLANQYMVDSTASSGEARVDAENQTGEKTVDIYNETALESATAMTEGSAAGVEGASKNASLLGNLFDKIKGWASNLATWVAKAFAGDESGSGSVNGDTVSGIRTVSFNKATYDKVDNTIDGKTIKEWTEIQKEVLKQNVDVYKVQLQGLNNAITNLETFKNAGLTGVSNSYSDKGAQGGTGKSGDAAKAAEKAANAAKDAAKETEKIAEEIEKIAEQYVKNVESMQDRIAKALKEKYQEQYDERKKLLEKEHEERVQQIQDEIDKINGNTTQDKKSDLERLYEKYEQWSKDDSTLGKARQKEYLDQIKELEKEIKIDELEKQLDEENEKYDQTIDKDSEFYDAILKKLDSQMTDEMLYREANDMIRNGKIDEITALLTKYDAQWDGWATLMGKTAGEIIAEEVALAIANYLDVVQGTITQDGGTHTNSITGGSSSASKNTSTSTHSGSSTGTSGGTVTTGSKVKINDTSTGMYYTSTSGGAVGNWSGYSGSYYVVNSNAGRVALARDNNVNNAIGWISKNKVTKLATGGYTGLGEGLAYLHAKERVLNARQTAAFENLIYNQLPKLERQSINGGNFGGTVNNFNKELVKVDVATINNYDSADVTNMGDNLDRMFRVSLQKAGIRKPR